MKILIISQWFYPEPDLKGLTFAKELKRQGHEVQALTGFPNYPGGKIYPGYKIKLLQRENIQGVDVIRVPLYPSHDSSGLKRIMNYLTFAFSAAILGSLLVKKADVMYVYHPPATIAIPAVVIKYLRGIPMVYDIQDLWPDTLKATGMFNNSLGLKLVSSYCNMTYKLMDRILVLSPGFKRILKQRGVKDNKIHVVYNWSNDITIPKDSEDKLKEEFGFSGKFTVLFAGTMGKAQALDSVLFAAERLQKTNPQIQFAFIGGGIEVENLKRIASEMELRNIVFLKRVPPQNVGRVLKAADILLVHLRKDPLFEITIPSKTQAYLMIGKPILMCVDGDAKILIEKSGAGKYCEPENHFEISTKVLEFYKMSKEDLNAMGKNGKVYYENNLSLKVGTQKISSIFNSVVNE